MNDTPDAPANLNGLEQSDFNPTGQAPEEGQYKALLQAVNDLKTENAELRDKHLRIVAEMENFRRRSERDKAEGMKYAVSEFSRDIISLADNLRRAIEAVPKDAVEQNAGLKTLLEGVEVTERELFKVFERHGITRFDPANEKFNPHLHEAMVKVDVPNVPADVIVQVLQAGYKIGERVLRPATVIVAKGGTVAAKPAAQAESAARPEVVAAAANGGNARDHSLQPAHEHDPDVVRDVAGVPRGAYAGRKDRPGEKRTSTVTQPVTDTGPITKDDLISSFGKRMENGN
jgi:molecular chaperone GrpE